MWSRAQALGSDFGFAVQLCSPSALWPLTSHLYSLNLSFLTCRMSRASRSTLRIKWDDNALGTVSTPQMMMMMMMLSSCSKHMCLIFLTIHWCFKEWVILISGDLRLRNTWSTGAKQGLEDWCVDESGGGGKKKEGSPCERRRVLFCGGGSTLLCRDILAQHLSRKSAPPPGDFQGANETSPGGLPWWLTFPLERSPLSRG